MIPGSSSTATSSDDGRIAAGYPTGVLTDARAWGSYPAAASARCFGLVQELPVGIAERSRRLCAWGSCVRLEASGGRSGRRSEGPSVRPGDRWAIAVESSADPPCTGRLRLAIVAASRACSCSLAPKLLARR